MCAPQPGLPQKSFVTIILTAALGCLLLAGFLYPLVPFAAWQRLASILFSAMLATACCTPMAIWLAGRCGAIDKPDAARKIHTRPIPRWGGMAIYLGVTATLLLHSNAYLPGFKAMLIGSSMVFAVGLADDVRPLPASLRLIVQVAACALLIHSGVHITFIPPTWWGTPLRWLITILWIVGITNAVNFLDGMDGLVSGLAGTSCLVFLGLALLQGSSMLILCALAIVGATIGFVGFNVRPARIFLGDSGSNFLGFYLAALGIIGDWSRNNPFTSFAIPILVLSVPIYDMIFITVSRIASGRVTSLKTWIEYTGRDHLHHRLEALGLGRGQVVLAVVFLNTAVGMGAIALFEARMRGALALLIQAACVFAILAMLEVLGRKRREAAQAQ